MAKKEISFTNEQLLAIQIENKDILVSAAAGSGKTAVLITRMVNRMLDPENPIDINKMLVVTYTNAAAAEMKKRLVDALEERRQEDKMNPIIRRQLNLLPQGQISTMSSFCLRIAREYFYLLDIDPNFRLGDSTEISILQHEVLEELFETLFTEKADYFLRLLDYFEEGLGDEQLKKALIDGLVSIRKHPWPLSFLEEEGRNLSVETLDDLWEKNWFQFLMKQVKTDLQKLYEASLLLETEATSCFADEKFLDVLKSDALAVKDLLSKISKTDIDFFISTVKTLKYNTLRRQKLEDEEEIAREETIIRKRNYLKEQVYALKDIFIKNVSEMILDLQGAHAYLLDFNQLLLRFFHAFKDTKKENSLADFSDLEHFALQVILEAESTVDHLMLRPEAFVLRNQFEEIYIDEYQDINMLQELILLAISGKTDKAPNRFMVGDIKQSIYRFRLANPDIFNDKYKNYPAGGDNYDPKAWEDKGEISIELSRNFRSQGAILESINDIFMQIMSEEVGEIEYTKEVALYPGRSFIHTNSAVKTSVHLIEQGEETDDFLQTFSKNQIEAAFIASEIEALIVSKYPIEEKGHIRPITYKDIVVLMRSPKQRADLMEQELSNRNIPAYNYNAEGYFEKSEVMTILSLLSVIDNPRQDIPLVSILYSPLFFFTPEELFLIAAKKEDNFYDNMLVFAKTAENELAEKIKKTLERIISYQEKALHTPIQTLIWFLYEDTGFYDLVGSMPGGPLRQGNLLALFDQALTFSESHFKGLFHFVRYIETLQQQNQDLQEAKILSETENVVRLMSIHKSKGLEFPVVFVANLEKKFYMPEITGSIIAHEDFGFGFKNYNATERVFTETIHRMAMKEKLRLESISEELRILYVALTRAEEKIYLTASIDSVEKIQQDLGNLVGAEKNIRLSSTLRKKGKSLLDFLSMALIRHPDGGLLRSPDTTPLAFNSTWFIEAISPAEILKTGYDTSRYQGAFLANIHEPINQEIPPEMVTRFSYQYPYIRASKTPSTISISEINRRFQADLLPESLPVSPSTLHAFEKSFSFPLPNWDNKPLSSGERGTLLHTMLEHISLNISPTNLDTYLDEFMLQLVEKNIITQQDIPEIPRRDIKTFLKSPLAARMRKSTFLYREWPFVMHLPPDLLENYPEEGILLHGIIDAAFVENNQLVLVDYKTDKIFPSLAAVIDRHRFQVSVYKKALEDGFSMVVAESILYLLETHEAISMDTWTL